MYLRRGGQTIVACRCAGPAVVPSEPRSHWQGWQASAAKLLSRRSSRTTQGGMEGEESLWPRRSSRRRSTSWQQRRSCRTCSSAAEAPGKALLPRGRCEPHDLSKHVVLLRKLGTHVIMKSHMNVICLQYRSLPLCRRSGLGAPGTSRPAGSCRGPGQVAVAGLHVRHPRPRPREVPLKVRYPGRVVVKAVLGDDILLVRRGRHSATYTCNLSTNDVATDTPLRVHLE
jgi:hypothetical protein